MPVLAGVAQQQQHAEPGRIDKIHPGEVELEEMDVVAAGKIEYFPEFLVIGKSELPRNTDAYSVGALVAFKLHGPSPLYLNN